MEFRVAECAYKARRMDAMTQLSVMAKLSPMITSGLGEFVTLIRKLREEGVTNLSDMSLDRLGQIATPVARELAKMGEDDRRFIIASCLDVCDRKRDSDPSWAKIWNPQAGRAMFDDINNDLAVMMKIVLAVLQGTFAGFLPESLSGLLGGARA